MTAPYGGLSAADLEGVGRALWATWRAIAPSVVGNVGGPVPREVAIELAVERVDEFGGVMSPAVAAFLRSGQTAAIVDAAEHSGFFRGTVIGL